MDAPPFVACHHVGVGRPGPASILLLCLLALPATAARATVHVSIYPASSSERVYEEEKLNLWASPSTENSRVVLTFGPASADCGAEPGADPRPVVGDKTVEVALDVKAVAPEPGRYRACAWELDPAGAVRDRGQADEDVLQQFAEATLDVDARRVWREIPITVFSSAVARRGRVLQTVLVRGACPPAAPAVEDPAVARWLGGPAGRTVGTEELELSLPLRLATLGTFQLCNWVGERPGDPAPEAAGSVTVSVVGGRARTALGLVAARNRSDGTKPVRWSGTVISAFRGPVFLEARRVVHSRSGRLRGSGPWRRVATVELSRQRLRAGRSFGLGGFAYVKVSGTTVLPRAIGRQCGGQSRIAQVRLRFPGTLVARPATSEVVELVGSLGGCR